MCFQNSTGKVLQARRDITCYKVVGLYGLIFEWSFVSLVQRFKYQLDVEYALGDTLDPRPVKWPLIRKKVYDVSEGFHSCSNLSKAKDLFNYVRIGGHVKLANDGLALVKCIIPEHSFYLYSLNYKEYVSSRIKITNEIMDVRIFDPDKMKKNGFVYSLEPGFYFPYADKAKKDELLEK